MWFILNLIILSWTEQSQVKQILTAWKYDTTTGIRSMGLLNIYLVKGAKVSVTLRDSQKGSQSQNSR